MSAAAVCPKCGAALPADAPAGLCPQCLLAVGLAGPSQAAGVPTTDQPPAGRFVPPTPAELAPAFPHLEILELLGSGGMGAVYKARQVHLDRLVALKILPPQLAQDPAFEERFNREARVLARLNHPHIVTVYDFGHTLPHPGPLPGGEGENPNPDPLPLGEGGERGEPGEGPRLYYLLMEYVDGTNLREVIRRGQLQPKEALAIVPQICEALQYAHDQGVVHRDIKPENILLDRQGRVKIADFGLARLAGQPPAGEAAAVGKAWTLTETGQVMGTPHYMAPEQLRGSHEVDHRADIYSLGVVFYEMLTGELPIGKFAPPSRKVQVDVRLDEVVLRALENEPERRYQQASEVKTDVEMISQTGVPQPRSPAGAEGAGDVPTPAPDADRFRELWKAGKSPEAGGGTSSAIACIPVTPSALRATMPMVLVCALGMLLGSLSLVAGVALAIYAFLTQSIESGEFWGYMGGAFGCFFGGGGALLGSWNSYRQLEGAGDLMKAPGWTWLDSLLSIYTLLGVLSIIGGLIEHSIVRAWVVTYSLLLLGGMMVFQGMLFLVCRSLYRRSAANSVNPPRT